MELSVVISLLALSVAVYGIFERQRAAYSALRVRLTELLSTIEDLNIEDLQYRAQADGVKDEDSGGATWSEAQQEASGAYASRRALLTYQAVDLLTRLEKARFGPGATVTTAEYCSLAISLRWCGDDALAITYFQAALSAKNRFLPRAVLTAASTGLGDSLFDHGRVEEARNCFLRATTVRPEQTLSGVSSQFFVYMQWLACEKRVQDGKPELPARGAYEIAAKPDWGPEFLYELNGACRHTIFVNEEYAEVELADLLKYSMAEILAGAPIGAANRQSKQRPAGPARRP